MGWFRPPHRAVGYGLKVGVVLPLINRRTSVVGRTPPKNLKKVDSDPTAATINKYGAITHTSPSARDQALRRAGCAWLLSLSA